MRFAPTILAILGCVCAARSAAAQTAPAPPHWTMSEDEPQRPNERPRGTPAGTIRGIYGHGVAYPIAVDLFDFREEGGVHACRGDRAAQEAYLRRVGSHRVDFWFYATAHQGVLFRREAHLSADRSAPIRSHIPTARSAPSSPTAMFILWT